MANETERHTYTDWRPATTVGMVVLAILVLVLLVLLIAAANQQQPFLMAVIVVMFGLVAGAFAAVVQRLNAAHRREVHVQPECQADPDGRPHRQKHMGSREPHRSSRPAIEG
jgi:Na+/melibiose symporter-like transporter